MRAKSPTNSDLTFLISVLFRVTLWRCFQGLEWVVRSASAQPWQSHSTSTVAHMRITSFEQLQCGRDLKIDTIGIPHKRRNYRVTMGIYTGVWLIDSTYSFSLYDTTMTLLMAYFIRQPWEYSSTATSQTATNFSTTVRNDQKNVRISIFNSGDTPAPELIQKLHHFYHRLDLQRLPCLPHFVKLVHADYVDARSKSSNKRLLLFMTLKHHDAVWMYIITYEI